MADPRSPIAVPRGPSRPEGEAPQDAVAVEHCGGAILEDHRHQLARVLAPDGALDAVELDVAAPVEAAGADLPPGRWGEVDAVGAQQGQVQRPGATGSGEVPPCGY